MSKKKNSGNNSIIKCTPACVYFPDMTVKPNEYEYDPKMCCNRRKTPKIFRCEYDNHILNWNTPCPRPTVHSDTGMDIQDVYEKDYIDEEDLN